MKIWIDTLSRNLEVLSTVGVRGTNWPNEHNIGSAANIITNWHFDNDFDYSAQQINWHQILHIFMCEESVAINLNGFDEVFTEFVLQAFAAV